MTRAIALVLLTSILGLSGAARADDASEAQLQYELGVEMYNQRRFSDALQRFLASNRLVPNANVTFNVAQAYELMERPLDAYNWYVAYLAMDADEEARASVEQKLTQLGARLAVLNIQTDPPDAELFIGRAELGSVGRSPRRVAVSPGSRRAIARLPNHRAASADVEAVIGEVTPVELSLEALMGTLRVESTPPGATVRVEGQDEPLGETPLERSLPVGSLALSISAEGYMTQRRDAVIRADEATSLSFRFERAATSVATLTVSGEPRGAAVFFDDRRVGTAPMSLGELPPGSGRVEIRHDSREPYATDITLEAGAATRIDYSLVDPDDRSWGGWRWIGYGSGAALLVAGGIVGLLALSEHDAFFENPTRDQLDQVETLSLTADILIIAGAVTAVTTFLIDLFSGPALSSRGSVTFER